MAERLLDQVRRGIRARFYSRRTEKSYIYWIRKYVRFHGLRHPRELNEPHVRAFLNHLAVDLHVAPNTQKVALNALAFLYGPVLGRTGMDFGGFRLADGKQKLPVVLSREELKGLFARLSGAPGLCARLMYGSGLRVMEVVRLRVHDIDHERLSILVRDGKGAKQRVTTLAESVLPDIDHQLNAARRYFEEDARRPGWPGVHLPHALARKLPAAPREWGWQYLFPAAAVLV